MSRIDEIMRVVCPEICGGHDCGEIECEHRRAISSILSQPDSRVIKRNGAELLLMCSLGCPNCDNSFSVNGEPTGCKLGAGIATNVTEGLMPTPLCPALSAATAAIKGKDKP